MCIHSIPDRQKNQKKMICELKKASTESLKPKTIFSDFEAGAMHGFEEEFPGVTIKGCNFHMANVYGEKFSS